MGRWKALGLGIFGVVGGTHTYLFFLVDRDDDDFDHGWEKKRWQVFPSLSPGGFFFHWCVCCQGDQGDVLFSSLGVFVVR